MSIDIDVTGSVADDREQERRYISWANIENERRARVRRQLDRMYATREEVERLCSADSDRLTRPATAEEIQRIAARNSQPGGEA